MPHYCLDKMFTIVHSWQISVVSFAEKYNIESLLSSYRTAVDTKSAFAFMDKGKFFIVEF